MKKKGVTEKVVGLVGVQETKNRQTKKKQEKQTHHSHRRTFKNKYDQSFFPLMTSCISGKSCRNLFDSYSSCLSPLASTC